MTTRWLMLVDDEADFLATVEKRLKRKGLDPDVVHDGPSALEHMEKTPRDVLVMDMNMPGMTGMETMARIRERWPDTAVIFLTGNASPRDGIEGIRAGAFDFLTKPVEFDHLVQKIGQARESVNRIREIRKERKIKKALQQELAANERLAALGTLATGVAHEINNPLAIINESAGFIRQVLDRKELAALKERDLLLMALGKIDTGLDRARRITHQLLSVVKTPDLALSMVDLGSMAMETRELVRRLRDQKQVGIVPDLPANPVEVLSDPYQIRQVFINLVTNAILASHPGETVSIRVEPLPGGGRVTVSDHGDGIAPEHMKRIFEPFFSTRKTGEGTGLGLFVTKGIVDRLNGKISVHSTLGKGANFVVDFMHNTNGQSVDADPKAR